MDRKNLIDEYERGGQALAQAIEGLTPHDLLAPPLAGVPELGTWTIQQVVIHLMDSDLIWTARMKSIISEEHPTILGYDETKFAANLFYELHDAQRAVRIFDLNRIMFAKVLRKLPESAFTRTGLHNERGEITLDAALQAMVEHVAHHVNFIRLKREKLAKPMK